MWNLADAKEHFDEIFEKALKEGPQEVVEGEARGVVVLSTSEYHQIMKRKPTLVEFLMSGPSLEGLDLDRDKSTGRDVIR